MKNRSIFLIVFLGVILSGSHSSTAQNLGIDRRLGQEGLMEVIQQIGIYNDPVLNTFVDSLGQKLVRQLANPAFEYNFVVVDMKEPNAFALPGGYIFVSRGLLCIANSEDELAGVIGHEIVHSQNRHSVQQMRKSILPALLHIPGAIVGTVVSEDLGAVINAPVSSGTQLFLSNYSRRHEKEADQIGSEISARAGYDPVQLAGILERLSAEMEVLTGEQEKFSYFDSHPYTPDRVKAITKYAERLEPGTSTPLTADSEDFLRRIDGVYFWENPRQGVFRENVFMHPDLGLYIEFPEGWETQNTPMAVGAVDTEAGKGMIYLGLAEENRDPSQLGEEFVKNLWEKHQVKPAVNGEVNLNGLSAYRVSLTDSSSGQNVGIHSLWFQLDTITFRSVGVAYESDFDLLRETALSIRMLTEEEKSGIEVPVIRTVAALEGETIDQLTGRTGNIWDRELTAVMNNIPEDYSFAAGQMVKVAVNEKYILPSGENADK